MNEQEATDLLERLGNTAQFSPPPVDTVLGAGRRDLGRRRGIVAAGVGCIVVLVIGAAVAIGSLEGADDPRRAATPPSVVAGQVPAESDLPGTWTATELFGQPVTSSAAVYRLDFELRDGTLHWFGLDACNAAGGTFNLDADGALTPPIDGTTMYCGDDPPVNAVRAIGGATQARLAAGQLVFYDEAGDVIGTFERSGTDAGSPVEAVEGLTGKAVGLALGLEPQVTTTVRGCQVYAQYVPGRGFCLDGVTTDDSVLLIIVSQINGVLPVEVPNLVGLDGDDAQQTLDLLDLNLVVHVLSNVGQCPEDDCTDVGLGQVLAQKPASGPVGLRSVVTLSVFSGIGHIPDEGDLVGTWMPTQLGGEKAPSGGMPPSRYLLRLFPYAPGLVWDAPSPDGCNTDSGRFRLRSDGSVKTGGGTTLVGCAGDWTGGMSTTSAVLAATQARLFQGQLVLYDADGALVGTFERVA